METSVDLGFLEECDEWLLANKFFRSKVGGKPAWLELKNIPSPKDLLCDECGEPCVFLCQVSLLSVDFKSFDKVSSFSRRSMLRSRSRGDASTGCCFCLCV